MAKTLPANALTILTCNARMYVEPGNDDFPYLSVAGCFTFDLDLSAEYVNPNDNTKTCHIKLAFAGENEGDFLAGFLQTDEPITPAGCVDRNGIVTFCNAVNGKYLNEVKMFIVDAETNVPYKVIGPMNFATLKVFDPITIANY